MPSYALSTATTTILHNAGAYTTTTDLTVATGHIYLIKDVQIRGNVVSTGAAGTGAFRWQVSDANGANFVDATPLIDIQSGAITQHNFDLRFAVPKAEIITAITTSFPTAGTDLFEQSSSLWNRTLAAGMKLRFTPLDTGSNGWNNTSQTWNVTLSVTYIDYTI